MAYPLPLLVMCVAAMWEGVWGWWVGVECTEPPYPRELREPCDPKPACLPLTRTVSNVRVMLLLQRKKKDVTNL